MITVETRAIPVSDVIFTALKDGEAVLLHLGNQTYYTLNETGSTVWKLIGSELSLAEISQTLLEKYDVSLNQAQQAVIELVDNLAAEKLVTVSG